MRCVSVILTFVDIFLEKFNDSSLFFSFFFVFDEEIKEINSIYYLFYDIIDFSRSLMYYS